MKKIIFVTGNKFKYEEVKNMLQSDKYEIEMLDIDVPEIQGTLKEIIVSKVKSIKKLLPNTDFIVEDSSLEFTALNGMPGPYVKWFLQSIGNTGLYNLLSAYTDKSASAISTIGYYDKKCIHIFTGIKNGKIVESRGNSSFGYDNIFMPSDYTNTYGELDPEIKNTTSHRRIAFTQLFNFLNE